MRKKEKVEDEGCFIGERTRRRRFPLSMYVLALLVAGGGWQPAMSGVCTGPAATGMRAGMRLRGGASAGRGVSNSTTAGTVGHTEKNAVSVFGVQGRVDYERLIRDWGSQVGFSLCSMRARARVAAPRVLR